MHNSSILCDNTSWEISQDISKQFSIMVVSVVESSQGSESGRRGIALPRPGVRGV